MRDDGSIVEDILKLGKNALGELLSSRHEFGAQARSRFDDVAQKLNLVSRREFDVAFAMLAKARAMQEDFDERLRVIEAHLNIATAPKAPAKKTKKAKNGAKANLRSVKHNKRR